MTIEGHEALVFLTELYNMTDGDTSRQVSMYDVGARIGLEKSSAGTIAEELIVDDYAELVTLSGGISITSGGLKELNITPADSSETAARKLGNEKILSQEGLEAVEEMLALIKGCVAGKNTPYETLEEIVLDIKTAELQLLSPKPKTEIIREVLRSLHESFVATEHSSVADQIAAMIGR